MAEQAKKAEEHDWLLAMSAAKDKEHDELIFKLQEESAVLLKKIESNSNEIEELKKLKIDKKHTAASYIIAVVALLVAVVQYFN